MDTLLVAGDHELGYRGLPVAIQGDDEQIQRALIRLRVRRGSFEEDPGLGSELYKLQGANPALWNRLALGYVQEALSAMTEVRVEHVEVERLGRDTLAVRVDLRRENRLYRLEVPVDEERKGGKLDDL